MRIKISFLNLLIYCLYQCIYLHRMTEACQDHLPLISTLSSSIFLCLLLFFCVCVCAWVCVRRAHCCWPTVMWFEGNGGGSITYYAGCAWVASEVISVKFDYHGAPIQTSRHHNASPSVTHNEGVPVELVILVLVANSAPGFLTSQLLTAPNVLGFLKSQHFAPTKLNLLVRTFSIFCGSGDGCSCREKRVSPAEMQKQDGGRCSHGNSAVWTTGQVTSSCGNRV